MAREAEGAESQEGGNRAGAEEDSLRMEETETAGEPGDREEAGGKGAVKGEPGSKEAQEEDVLEEMSGPVWPPVRRSRGWRPTLSVSRLAERDAEINERYVILMIHENKQLVCEHERRKQTTVFRKYFLTYFLKYLY